MPANTAKTKRDVSIRVLEPGMHTCHSTIESASLTILEGDKAIEKAAETVSLSFGPDPLLMWIYESKELRWDMLIPTTQRWQEARLRHSALTGFLYSAVCNSENSESSDEDVVGVAHLHPPVSDSRVLSPLWWWRWTKLFCLQTFGLVKESCGDERVRGRSAGGLVGSLTGTHVAGGSNVRWIR